MGCHVVTWVAMQWGEVGTFHCGNVCLYRCRTLRVLLFNLTGPRKPETMLSELVVGVQFIGVTVGAPFFLSACFCQGIGAHYALFCPNVSFSGADNTVGKWV